MPKIHYFNPGHETAVLLGKSNYTPPANVLRMHKELACLPAWYADSDDYVLVPESILPDCLSLQGETLFPSVNLVSRNELKAQAKKLPALEAAPWGISLPGIQLFKQLNSSLHLNIVLPEWNDIYVRLTGRMTAATCLDRLQQLLPYQRIPETPVFCTEIADVEQQLLINQLPVVIKTPYSSSGRGVLWIEQRKLSEQDRHWIQGALIRQGRVSIERGLQKVQDCAMEFFSDGRGNVRYEGLSLFGTENGGAYSGNLLQDQQAIRCRIAQWIGEECLMTVQKAVEQVLSVVYGNVYCGYLGVDMLVYKDSEGNYALHPCIEINMRYTMGMVALRIFKGYVSPSKVGSFRITYDKGKRQAYEQHRFMQKEYPLQLRDGKIEKGYLPLSPVSEESCYRAYVLVE